MFVERIATLLEDVRDGREVFPRDEEIQVVRWACRAITVQLLGERRTADGNARDPSLVATRENRSEFCGQQQIPGCVLEHLLFENSQQMERDVMSVGRMAEPTKEERGYSLRDGFFNDGLPRIVRDDRRLILRGRDLRQQAHQKRMD